MGHVDVVYSSKLKIKATFLRRLFLGLWALSFVVTSCKDTSVSNGSVQTTPTTINSVAETPTILPASPTTTALPPTATATAVPSPTTVPTATPVPDTEPVLFLNDQTLIAAHEAEELGIVSSEQAALFRQLLFNEIGQELTRRDPVLVAQPLEGHGGKTVLVGEIATRQGGMLYLVASNGQATLKDVTAINIQALRSAGFLGPNSQLAVRFVENGADVEVVIATPFGNKGLVLARLIRFDSGLGTWNEISQYNLFEVENTPLWTTEGPIVAADLLDIPRAAANGSEMIIGINAFNGEAGLYQVSGPTANRPLLFERWYQLVEGEWQEDPAASLTQAYNEALEARGFRPEAEAWFEEQTINGTNVSLRLERFGPLIIVSEVFESQDGVTEAFAPRNYAPDTIKALRRTGALPLAINMGIVDLELRHIPDDWYVQYLRSVVQEPEREFLFDGMPVVTSNILYSYYLLPRSRNVFAFHTRWPDTTYQYTEGRYSHIEVREGALYQYTHPLILAADMHVRGLAVG